MLLSDQSRIYRSESGKLGKSKFCGTDGDRHFHENRVHHFDALFFTLYEHVRSLFFKKKFNYKIIIQ